MLLRLQFQVTPRGKQTARTSFQRGRARTWTPEQTAMLQERIRLEAISQLNQKGLPRPLVPAPSPVFLLTTHYLARPTRGLSARMPFPSRKPYPDLSNMTKLLEDALNGVLWTDDSQVVQNLERKVWAPAEPSIEVIVADLDEMEDLYPSVDELEIRRRSRTSGRAFVSSRVSRGSTRITYGLVGLVAATTLATCGLCLARLTTAATLVC